MTLLKTLLCFLSTTFNLALYPPDLSRIMRKCLWGQTDAEFQSHFCAFGLLSPVRKRKCLSAFLTLSSIPLPEFSANALRRKAEQVTGAKMASPLLISSFLWDLLSVGSVSSRFFLPPFFFLLSGLKLLQATPLYMEQSQRQQMIKKNIKFCRLHSGMEKSNKSPCFT